MLPLSILSLVAMFSLGVAFCFYARCILVRSIIHRVSLSALHASALHNTRLDAAVIASLPTFTILPNILETIDCSVCLSPLQSGETAKLLPGCKHSFHAPCIDTWLHSNATCPLCRTRVDQPRLEPHNVNREAPIGFASDAASPLALEVTSSNGGDHVYVSFAREVVLLHD